MELTDSERLLIETRVNAEAPTTGMAYIFWLLLGAVSAHRFYLGRPGSAVLQIVSVLVVIGILWVLVDGFLIPGMIRARRDEIRQRLTLELLTAKA